MKMTITKAEVLRKMVEDDEYFEAWRLIERFLVTDKRYSVRAWLFAHEMIQVAEKLRGGG